MAMFNRGRKGEADAASEPVEQADDEEAVIDLRSPSDNGFGCPECGGPGFLDHIDLRRGVQYMHCRACEHRWTTEAVPTSG